jgi:peptidoglycan hydrolase CwlO-like protein
LGDLDSLYPHFSDGEDQPDPDRPSPNTPASTQHNSGNDTLREILDSLSNLANVVNGLQSQFDKMKEGVDENRQQIQDLNALFIQINSPPTGQER